jgi:hypothetical protein
LLFSNHVPCWFEDLDKGNIVHIQLYAHQKVRAVQL